MVQIGLRMSVKRHIYIVTHGEKFTGSNPRMTPKGFQDVSNLRDQLPAKPGMVISGTGQRHDDVSRALGFEPDQWSDWAGTPDSLEVIGEEKFAVLANGRYVPLEKHTSVADIAPVAKVRIPNLPHESVICSGRPLMIILGINGKSAAIYRITTKFYGDDNPGNEIVEIEEITAQGVVDPALQSTGQSWKH